MNKLLDTVSKCNTDKESRHKYISGFYKQEFEKYKNLPINLLEIGVNQGGSLQLWLQYFNNANRIVGIDHNLNDIHFVHPKLYLYQDNAYREHQLGYFDIIIDDGSHKLDDQLFILQHYLQYLKYGGILIIEDVQNIKHAQEFKNLIADGTIIDLRNVSGASDSILFVVRR